MGPAGVVIEVLRHHRLTERPHPPGGGCIVATADAARVVFRKPCGSRAEAPGLTATHLWPCGRAGNSYDTPVGRVPSFFRGSGRVFVPGTASEM